MLVFDGTYMLERKEDLGMSLEQDCAWRVKIIDFSSGDPLHPHIRPHAVLAFRKEEGIFKTSCAESLGKRIFRDFKIHVSDVLWVEAFPNLSEAFYVAVFTPRYHDAETHYRVDWRPILDNERTAIASWC